MNISHMNHLARTTVLERPDGSGNVTYNDNIVLSWTNKYLYVRPPRTALARRRLAEALTHLGAPWTLGYNRAQNRATLTRLARIHRKACVCAVKVPFATSTLIVSRNPHGLGL